MPGQTAKTRTGGELDKEDSEKEEENISSTQWHRDKGAFKDHPEFWLDDKIEAQIIHWII